MMAEAPARRFTLLDAMVLLAATAAGLAGVRASVEFVSEGIVVDDEMYILIPTPPAGGWTPLSIARYAPHAMQLAVPPLMALSLALPTLRLKRPRPRLRRIAVQPGAIACAVAVVALAFGAAEAVRESFASEWGLFEPWEEWDEAIGFHARLALRAAGRFAAFGVALGWVGLAIGGRLRAEPSWIDRAGRLLGVLWIVVFLAGVWLPVQETFWPTLEIRAGFH